MLYVKYRFKKFQISYSATLLVALLFSGCATTSPKAEFKQVLQKEHLITANDTVSIKVEANQGVVLEDSEKKRLSQKIKNKIDEQKKNNIAPNKRGDYEIDVVITQYEKGNAFARAMLAGAGQIHIDAHISMFSLPERTKLTEFDINKTFAWGGIYGASTSIEDVEQGFAEGVAETVTKGNE